MTPSFTSNVIAACLVFAVPSANAEDHCATPAEIQQVQQAAAKIPGRLPFMLAKELGLSEAQIASALPKSQAIGVTNAAFMPIWESLTMWNEAVVLILTGGHTLEVHGPVHKGTPSTRSKNFNLDMEGAGLGGHLRPDLVSAIYALAVPGKDGAVTRGVAFMDADGKSAFGIYVPSEGAPPTADQIAAFERTWNVFKVQPAVCGS